MSASEDVPDTWDSGSSSGEEEVSTQQAQQASQAPPAKAAPGVQAAPNADLARTTRTEPVTKIQAGQANEDNENEGSDESSSDDDDDATNEQKILNQYRRLLSRRVDLVGDYAGNELFLIEGDSLLLRCFGDDKLDFSPGLQLLHAVYNVEHFLHNLAYRKCNFHIAFFESSRELCVPPTADKADASKYYLARAVIIRHLQANLPRTHPDIKVNFFQSSQSDDFAHYLRNTSLYFLMAHDGASPIERVGKHITKDASGASAQRLALRALILAFMGRGYNVALVNGLEWRDTKVMTMVLETRQRAALTDITPTSASAKLQAASGVATDIGKIQKSGDMSERQLLIVLTVSRLMQSPPKDIDTKMLAQMACTLLLQSAFIAYLPLSARRLDAGSAPDHTQTFLRHAAGCAASILASPEWTASSSGECDVADAIDGRLFIHVTQQPDVPDGEVAQTFAKLVKAAGQLAATDLPSKPEAAGADGVKPTQREPATRADLSVLPFSNPVFDKHLEPIHLKIDDEAGGPQSATSHKIFREATHWHNAKKPLIVRPPPTAATARQESKAEFWAKKRNQMFMAEMQKYAASLTNAVGKSLEPETIIVGAAKTGKSDAPADSGKAAPKGKGAKAGTESPADSDASTGSKGKAAQKKPASGKNAKQNASKQAMLDRIALEKASKDQKAGSKIVDAWSVVCKNFETDKDPRSRYKRAKDYLTSVRLEWREVLEAELQLYMLNCLIEYWLQACRKNEQKQRVEVLALIWQTARNVLESSGLTKTIVSNVELTAKSLKLPTIPSVSTDSLIDRPLKFKFALPAKVDSMAVLESPREFQLLHCGPYLERSFDSKPDSRVEFNPDGWQRRVLDGIDADKSVFVVAPTSAGKTFISFYAMRKVLEADDDGVLVYVAPTKALVNQIAAEVQARYSKSYKYGGKSVWAIHTRDYRINNPQGCQVLVTVPHVLQILLMSPTHANSWSPRVKRIIFDEVHSIGQAEDGVVWEQLLLMAPCPIIALSATVGNPEEFSQWLTSTQSAIGNELLKVEHPYRYSDLRKHYYVPPKRFAFQGLPPKGAFGALGLEGLKGFKYIHPVAGLIDKTRGIPADLGLEPRDCLILWQTMFKHQTKDYPVPKELDPQTALPEVSRKVDILNWEKKLKDVLRTWLDDDKSPYDELIKDLEREFRDDKREDLQATLDDAKDSDARNILDSFSEQSVMDSTLPMLCRLHQQEALPAILFNYDRHQCEKICQVLLQQLSEAEESQVKSGPKWERTLEAWETWKKMQLKNAKTAKAASKSKKSKGDDDDEGDERGSKLDQQRDAGGADASKWDTFDPNAPQEGYHFADLSRVQRSEMEIYVKQLGRRNVAQWLIDALARGIGVHHAGMNRKYRQVCEILFRKGFLRVIVATGTLALGINMPCKTVVFSGDSVFLTALNYRQCAGRAGRRGFDLLGNVVFQGLSRDKVCRLLSSRLPDLNGHFPITTTLVLRLFTLLHESKNAKYAVSAINALLSQPRMYMGGPSFKDQTMHHLRFSIEYLRRQYLLDSRGATLNFAGLVSHLYFTENSSFAFHALLKEGYFHELCANIGSQERDTVETLMLVMAHLFNRIPCRQADQEYREKVVKPSSSIVFLPPLPQKASQILSQHNRQTLDVYKTYVETFVNQHIKHDDRKLPLTGLLAGGNGEKDGMESLPPTRIRSAFVALSGAGDHFDNIHDLCATTRDGVFLEEAVIPHVEVYPDEMEVPLNAWLLDFFKHGDVDTLEKANGIRRADIWFLLNVRFLPEYPFPSLSHLANRIYYRTSP